MTSPVAFQPHLVHDKELLESWRFVGDHISQERHLYLGILTDGRGWMEDTGERNGWIHADVDAARAECQRRMTVEPERWSPAAIPARNCPNGCGPLRAGEDGHLDCDQCGYWR